MTLREWAEKVETLRTSYREGALTPLEYYRAVFFYAQGVEVTEEELLEDVTVFEPLIVNDGPEWNPTVIDPDGPQDTRSCSECGATLDEPHHPSCSNAYDPDGPYPPPV